MKWTPGSRENIEDRRGQRGFGGGRGGPIGIGVVLVLLVLSLLTGRNFLSLVDPGAVTGGGESAPAGGPVEASPEEERLVDFMGFVLKGNQDVWRQLLGAEYQETTLVLFRNTTSTACGYGQSASGPFYCPGDGKVYLDLSFFDELDRRFGASGDFAQAYVIAHEVGHHIQNLTGLERRVRQTQQQHPDQANELSVRMELQADCYAGVWAGTVFEQGALEAGDLEEAFAASEAVGDDRLQRQAGRSVDPDSFTHGTSEQRREWFTTGYESVPGPGRSGSQPAPP
jgi:predicted metalloprotease